MHTRTLLISGFVALAALLSASPKSESANDAPAAFARLKTLVGEWEANMPDGKAHLTYELTGGGTVLVERESEDKMPSMMTVYHLDGDRLILTHYCMTGNQPRMQARAINLQTGEIQFQFLDATNLANPNAVHMHNVRLRLVDNNHLDADWQLYENAAPKETESAHYTRVR
ncbi:MAG TPA: hypothetical protein VKG79_07965 [Bryobacteraceae bacterium]|nr:hypothetical protein [Bryobacteraceae bacterium]